MRAESHPHPLLETQWFVVCVWVYRRSCPHIYCVSARDVFEYKHPIFLTQTKPSVLTTQVNGVGIIQEIKVKKLLRDIWTCVWVSTFSVCCKPLWKTQEQHPHHTYCRTRSNWQPVCCSTYAALGKIAPDYSQYRKCIYTVYSTHLNWVHSPLQVVRQ